jgi:hypothetical protein
MFSPGHAVFEWNEHVGQRELNSNVDSSFTKLANYLIPSSQITQVMWILMVTW